MKYREINPGVRLKNYVKFYFIYESSSDASFDDTVFPSGNVEIIFNMGSGRWQIGRGDEFVTTPPIEFWGQIIQPLPIRSIGKNTMLGIRFFTHASACFFEENIELFNNQVIDFSDLSGNPVQTLHARLLETNSWDIRIGLIEEFLLSRLSLHERKNSKMEIVTKILNEIKQEDFFENIDTVASRYGITSRYLQKLFLQYTGLTPKLYSKINRFQNSLKLISQKNTPLTSIAYDCGYFDQSHFIRDFKSFTGTTPTGYTSESSPMNFAFTNG